MGVEGGTGKAEAAKLQDAGISPKQCPKKMSGLPDSIRVGTRRRRTSAPRWKNCRESDAL
jgi:hypothetical protein